MQLKCVCVHLLSKLRSTAVDFTNEALTLLEEVAETADNADRLKDDKAHAFLWLYICTLEKNLQEVSTGAFVSISYSCSCNIYRLKVTVESPQLFILCLFLF